MRKTLPIIGLICLATSLSGCIAAAAAGAGAAGALIIDKKYDISVNKRAPRNHNTN